MVKASASETCEFVLREIRSQGDLPAMGRVVSLVSKLAASEDCTVADLANALLSDYALTHKVLRVVNSAVYRPAAEEITTISRAIIVLGWNAVRSIALTFRLFESMGQGKRNPALKEVLGEAFCGAVVARNAAVGMGFRDREQAFVGALFHSYGRMLMAYYLPDKTEEELGISPSALGMAVAEQLNFPEPIRKCMKPRAKVRNPRHPTSQERLAAISVFGNEVSSVLMSGRPPDEQKRQIQKIAKGMEKQLGRVHLELDDLVEKATQDAAVLGAKIGIKIARRLPGQEETGAEAETGAGEAKTSSERPAATASAPASVAPDDSAQTPLPQVQGASSTRDAIELALEAMRRILGGVGVRSVLYLELRPADQSLRLMAGTGQGVSEARRRFRFHLPPRNDLVSAAVACQRDAYFAEGDAAAVSDSLPPWAVERLRDSYLVLLPVIARGQPRGVFWIEGNRGEAMPELKTQLQQVRRVRDQIVACYLRTSAAAPGAKAAARA